MFIYKLTCETGKVYYGATKNQPKYRRGKGHYHCSCKDFINPKIEIIEKCETIEDLFIREKWYIQNNECVNINGSIKDLKEYYKLKTREYRKNNPQKVKETNAKYLEKIECNICGKETSKKHIKRHQQTNKCINFVKG